MKLAGRFEIESKLAPGARVQEVRPIAPELPKRTGRVDSLDLSWDGESATLFGFLVLFDDGTAESYTATEFGHLEVLDPPGILAAVTRTWEHEG